MSTQPSAATSPFGDRLRKWRRHRGLSQLELAIRAGSTSRHVSFLETGRSRPSREMVLRLGEVLEVGLRESNLLLEAAGLTRAYPERRLQDADLGPYRDAMDRLLTAHQPYPALVVDAHWNVVSANAAAALVFGSDLVGGNIVRRYLADPAAAERIVNWAQVTWAGLFRLRHQLTQAPFDDELAALVELVEDVVRDVPRPAGVQDPSYMVCPWFRIGDEVVRTIGMVARFEPATEITLDELRVELTYPADADAERFFRLQRSS